MDWKERFPFDLSHEGKHFTKPGFFLPCKIFLEKIYGHFHPCPIVS